uniref:Complement C3 n=1 Tax=Latimeria chalumnae TaxID=7897 RepID=H3B954_LATCH
LQVRVENPDESLASNVPVTAEPGTVEGRTNKDGEVKLRLNTPGVVNNLQITVKTEVENLSEQQQAKATYTVEPYQTQGGSRNYLHIGIPSLEMEPNENLNIDFYLTTENPGIENQIKYISYLIMSRGKLIRAGHQQRLQGQALVTMPLLVAPEFIPSFRIVAYYHVNRGGQLEIVSDSAWVDVKDTCMGTLRVTSRGGTYQPADQLKITLQGDPGAKVGLVIVDKAVYVLNKKYKITQSKMWDSVEKSDIGCTPGGGANNMGVFSDAGLVFETNKGINTAPRTALHCPQPSKRKRRTVNLIEAKTSQVTQFQDKNLKMCCEDGMKQNPMGHSCEKRAQYIQDNPDCVKAFLQCCNYISKLTEDQKKELVLGRSDEDEDYLSSEEILSRSDFPESWLWQVVTMPKAPVHANGLVSNDIITYLKDSITTWELLAVSLSPKKGICVADPYEITVLKDFFIDLRLPYSVVRNEQVEVRAVLYNYGANDIIVRVEFLYNEKLCSAATRKTKFRQEVTIKAHSSQVVPYVVIPLELGQLEIEVKAAVRNQFVSDGVKKKLKVVPEGILMRKDTSIVLSPEALGKNGEQEEIVHLVEVEDIVPGTEPETIISVKGNVIEEIIENSIDGANLKHLIRVPSGCGEQNMITMTPGVIATHYLDKTKQWERIGMDQRERAIGYIRQGYTQQLAFRKPDNSFAVYLTHSSSTWLTAYVVKVFAMADTLIAIDPQVLCGAVKWLVLEKQKPDGLFQETATVYHKEMQGGYVGSEGDASLTAFVLIAMAEAREVCSRNVASLEGSIQKAEDYLKNRLPELTRPYSIAITSYALALLGNEAGIFKLIEAATPEGDHWPEPKGSLFTIEATAYALLANLHYRKADRIPPIVKWLTEQRFYGGGYGSTQATIIAFQALALYQLEYCALKETNLDISLQLPGRSNPTNWKITEMNLGLAKSESGTFKDKFMVVAKGSGEGTMTVQTVYYAVLANENKCNKFDLRVTVEEAPDARRPENALGSLKLTVCSRFKEDADSTMTILDITMLTGYSPDIGDLNRLQNGVDRYISKYEMDKVLSAKGSLIIYLDKVSSKEDDCIALKLHQMYKVGLIQPAAVTVYEYYNTENHCTRFYHPTKESGLLSKICQAEVCRCAEEKCGALQKHGTQISIEERTDEACAVGVDYVYKAKFVDLNETDSHDTYVMQILEVIKAGSDKGEPKDQRRNFISHKICRESLNLQLDKEYLVMGHSTDLWDTATETNYIIGGNTWIEWWPTEAECQNPSHQNLCNDFFQFADQMLVLGCPN